MALILSAVTRDSFRARLHIGMATGHRYTRSKRWAPVARVVTREQIDRLATKREEELGVVGATDGGGRVLSREEIARLYPQAVAS